MAGRRAVANQHQIGEGAADVDADAIAGTRHASVATPKTVPATREPGCRPPGTGARLARMRTGIEAAWGGMWKGIGWRRVGGGGGVGAAWSRPCSGSGWSPPSRGAPSRDGAAGAGGGAGRRRGGPGRPRRQGWPPTADRVGRTGPGGRAGLARYFRAARVPYPPTRFVLLGLKQERELQLFAAGPDQQLAFVRTYPIYGASGVLGPKLREGDRQVPEGIYTIAYMNPNSISHLSRALSYTNDFDRARAAEDGRADDTLGGSIMIHGGSGSIGCMAVGDEAAEDLFILTADAGWDRGLIVVSPVDFRRTDLPADYRASTPWVNDLYAWIRAELDTLPLAPPPAASVASGAP